MVNRTMNIVVTEYNKDWPKQFDKEVEKIRDILKYEIVKIHHIGSTAVPGLKAKPIIDMMPIVRDIESIDKYNKEMIEIGYESLGELGIQGRRYFRKGGEERTHQIHIFQGDNITEIERHLAVRDYLKSHKETADEYGELKAQLALQFPKDIEGYSDGKDEFVQNLEQIALEWKRKSSK
ncbi:GrpB family protein [Staphylococcus succinus]|uniref:GrpB family protein n=1 Tax=Staphylococcus succinus TaxID=61015 RepID=UPI002DB8EBFB|nr:GrpB family protein [Staphylococcus succinus]MEB7463563.1 GrpB family protein [Staphylococcus succinus]